MINWTNYQGKAFRVAIGKSEREKSQTIIFSLLFETTLTWKLKTSVLHIRIPGTKSRKHNLKNICSRTNEFVKISAFSTN